MNTLQRAIYMYNYTLYSFTIKKCGPRRSHLDIMDMTNVAEQFNLGPVEVNDQLSSNSRNK